MWISCATRLGLTIDKNRAPTNIDVNQRVMRKNIVHRSQGTRIRFRGSLLRAGSAGLAKWGYQSG